jgi:hypothetical protein
MASMFSFGVPGARPPALERIKFPPGAAVIRQLRLVSSTSAGLRFKRTFTG